jgi:anti-anti-sigma factor
MAEATKKEELLSSRLVDDVAVIEFTRGRIRDEREILKTLESLARYIESRSGLKVLLDLSNVEYLSSAGLGHLVGLLKKSRTRGTAFKVCALRDPIHELFEVMHLDKIFEIYSGVKEGVDSFKAPPHQGPEVSAKVAPALPSRP